MFTYLHIILAPAAPAPRRTQEDSARGVAARGRRLESLAARVAAPLASKSPCPSSDHMPYMRSTPGLPQCKRDARALPAPSGGRSAQRMLAAAAARRPRPLRSAGRRAAVPKPLLLIGVHSSHICCHAWAPLRLAADTSLGSREGGRLAPRTSRVGTAPTPAAAMARSRRAESRRCCRPSPRAKAAPLPPARPLLLRPRRRALLLRRVSPHIVPHDSWAAGSAPLLAPVPSSLRRGPAGRNRCARAPHYTSGCDERPPGAVRLVRAARHAPECAPATRPRRLARYRLPPSRCPAQLSCATWPRGRPTGAWARGARVCSKPLSHTLPVMHRRGICDVSNACMCTWSGGGCCEPAGQRGPGQTGRARPQLGWPPFPSHAAPHAQCMWYGEVRSPLLYHVTARPHGAFHWQSGRSSAKGVKGAREARRPLTASLLAAPPPPQTSAAHAWSSAAACGVRLVDGGGACMKPTGGCSGSCLG